MPVAVLLSALAILTAVNANCNFSEPLLDPDPNDDSVTVKYEAFLTQIRLKEEIGNIKIAVFNCDESDQPTIRNFVVGNNNDLGLKTEKSDGSWFLVVNKSQDYEIPNQRGYRFYVEVASRSLEVDISLVNVDDAAPYFSLPDSKPCEVSEIHTGSTSCHLLVYDPDGIMEPMKYTVKEMEAVSQAIELVADAHETCGPGEANCINVVLEVKGKLEFIEKPVHSLLLEAQDQAGHTGNISYIVQVKAENKNIPTIRPEKLMAEIREEYSGVIVFDGTNITVSDGDSVEYGQYSITLEGNGKDKCYEAFDVIPRAGYKDTDVKLSVIKPELLDYDQGTCNDIIIKIKATENNDDTRIGVAEVNIKLKDINDEFPVFEKESFTFTVDEHAAIGTYLGSVKANDRDASDNITYSLTSQTYMTIDSVTGSVTVNADFNYERQPQVIVTVKAEDSNEPPHVDYAQITVNVNDINDEKPELYMPSSPTSINESTPIGEALDVDISATDEDSDPELSFSIDWETSRAAKQGVQQNKDVFTECIAIETKVDPNNKKNAKAALTVAKLMDWETFDTLYVTVNVEDRNTDKAYLDKQFSSATLTITINDLNDNPPKFSPIGELRFKEGSEEDQLIGIITATDPDGNGNNEVTYYLVNDLYEKEYVTINNKSGELRTGKDKIDFEEITAINYIVTASDGELSDDMGITIVIDDVNDEKPYFIGDYDTPISVPENTAEKRGLIIMKARDDDASPEFNTLRYEMDQRYRGIFDIDPVTGEVFVPKSESESNRLDYETAKSYTVEITVKDRCYSGDICYGDSSSNMTRITILLEDLNDNAPVITNGGVTLASVSELVGQGVLLGYVTADDADSGRNAELTYSFTDVEPPGGWELFSIQDDVEKKRGTITVNKDLTNKWGSYRLTVMVQDTGNLSDTDSFTIIVQDTNNNPPKFVLPDTTEIRLNIAENVQDEALTDVNGRQITFRATDDLDKGLNGTDGMSYSLIGDDTAMKYLTMPHDEIWLKEQFTEDMPNTFKLKVEACDGETEKLCTKKEISVRMRVNIEYEPTFAESEWTTDFTENKTGLEEKKQIEVKVTDRNDDEDCEDGDLCTDNIYYFIIDGNSDIFHLEKETGIISLKKELDREVVDVYVLTVVVTNNVNGPQSLLGDNSKLRVTINVIDEIDTSPAFNKTLYAAGINTGDKNGDSVTTFTASDGDLNDKLTYRIIDGTMDVTDSSLQYWQSRNPFTIKENILLLNFDVQDSSLKGLFKFNAEVTDTGNNTDEVACQIYIITENNHVIMRFQNNVTYAESRKLEMENIFTNVFKNPSNVKKVSRSVDTEGVPIDDKTDITAYFVNEDKQEPIEKSEITRQLTDKQTYNALREALLGEKLVLESIDDPESETAADMEGVLQTVLIVVSIVLGTLVIILFAAFFIRTRSLNRRLEALSTTKFGSQDSGLNRIGMAVPNTNQHAIEGSNPVWGNENVTNHDFDAMSQSSGDSDLIGIEENPEFSPYARNGMSNDGFTPDFETGRRASVNPVLANGYGRRASVNPLSAAAMQDVIPRSQSVNPMAGGFDGDDSDYENDSRRSSDNNNVERNSNFTFFQRTDSTPTTEL